MDSILNRADLCDIAQFLRLFFTCEQPDDFHMFSYMLLRSVYKAFVVQLLPDLYYYKKLKI